MNMQAVKESEVLQVSHNTNKDYTQLDSLSASAIRKEMLVEQQRLAKESAKALRIQIDNLDRWNRVEKMDAQITAMKAEMADKIAKLSELVKVTGYDLPLVNLPK